MAQCCLEGYDEHGCVYIVDLALTPSEGQRIGTLDVSRLHAVMIRGSEHGYTQVRPVVCPRQLQWKGALGIFWRLLPAESC